MKTIKVASYNTNGIIETTLQILKAGGLVIFPSDTVYGALVDATNEAAVKKLIAFKNRPIGKAISVFVADFPMMEQVVMLKDHEEILKSILPGPFTAVLPSKHTVSKLLESERGSLGVRIPKYGLVRELVRKFQKPVTATSANLSGRSPHYSIETLLKEFSKSKLELIDLVVDAGKLPRNKPSTVIDLTTPDIKIIRKGDIVLRKQQTYVSTSPHETKKVAEHILDATQQVGGMLPVALILQGELGVGKTVFVKGLAETLGIDDIISPTYVIYYGYQLQQKPFKNLYHFDLYNIAEKDEFKPLGIGKMLQERNLLCFEWGEKSGEILSLLKQAYIVYIHMRYVDEKTREIEVAIPK